MPPRFAALLGLLVSTALASGQSATPPEQLLSANTQFYVRWDGLKAHQSAHEATALGKMLKGDTGKFLAGLNNLLNENIGSALTVQGLLEGTKPDELEKLQANAAEAAKLLTVLRDQGFILAIEARTVLPPAAQVTMMIPNVDNPAPLFGALRLATGLAGVPVKEVKADNHTYAVVEIELVRLGWWMEGKHAVVALTTDTIESAAKRMRSSNHPRLPTSPLFKQLGGFKEFETAARAFIDVASLAKLASGAHKDAGPLLKKLGLDGLKSVTFYSGFEGVAERGLTELEMTGERAGLLKLLGGKPFTLKDVPPLPPDVLSWSMSSFDPALYYDTILGLTEMVVELVDKDQLADIKQGIEAANKLVGFDIRKDLLDTLGEHLVQYSSPSEGVFSLSQTILMRVKDAKKLEASLDKAIRALAEQAGVEVTIEKKKYRGVEISEIYVAQQGFIFVPTYAIHNGWFVVSYFPQPVQGYILRATGELRGWQPGPAVVKAFDSMPKEFLSISVSDPRPTVKQLLTIAPLVGGAVRSFLPEVKFDVGSLPNGQEATRHLFPNVTVATENGSKLRIHTRASLGLPFDLGGPLDLYFFAFAGLGAFGVN